MANLPDKQQVYCPKCGSSITMRKVKDLRTRAGLQDKGYMGGYEGDCQCGVQAILAMKKMPENPSFTLMFNIVKLNNSLKEKK